ncbi:unnamed protein product [Amoebophrya sp. A120]|nr:unnamed protein product [Amoebophrya sp. A120]|eukprot:GSA120T00001233001.1
MKGQNHEDSTCIEHKRQEASEVLFLASTTERQASSILRSCLLHLHRSFVIIFTQGPAAAAHKLKLLRNQGRRRIGGRLAFLFIFFLQRLLSRKINELLPTSSLISTTFLLEKNFVFTQHVCTHPK